MISNSLLLKCPTGIKGLDEITLGGLPMGRPTLVCGGPGCGKTLLAMEFLVRGANDFNEPGVFMAFEESSEELAKNVASLGFDLDDLVARKRMVVSQVRVEGSEIEETGEYDLEGLFIRLGYAIDSVGARRVVLDTLETLFGSLNDQGIIRAELRRLFRWMKNRGVTAVITGEGGEVSLTRHGLEEYVSDCVIVLDHRPREQMFTRRLRIVKYRGSSHGTNEYPFLIDAQGIDVVPITSLGLDAQVSSERISTGVPELDDLLGGGVYRGSNILASGSAGTGKTTLASTFLARAAQRGERSLYVSFEESQSQTLRNMRSVGLDLQPLIEQGLLCFHPMRPTQHGLQMHLATLFRLVRELKPRNVVLDPVTGLLLGNSQNDVRFMLMRLVEYLKVEQITCLLTALNASATHVELGEAPITSLIDTWFQLLDIEICGARKRGFYILKSRGMAHSNQILELILSSRGLRLQPWPVPQGPEPLMRPDRSSKQEGTTN